MQYLNSRPDHVVDSVLVGLDFFEDCLELSQGGRRVGKRPAKVLIPGRHKCKTIEMTEIECVGKSI